MDIRWQIKDIMMKVAVRLLKMTEWYGDYWSLWRGHPFKYAENNGLHILPVHFYSPIPNSRDIPQDLWQKKNKLAGVDLSYEKSLKLLGQLSDKYQVEYEKFSNPQATQEGSFRLPNGTFGCGDAELLYSMVRHIKPRKIIEIGAGLTTLITSLAIRQNQSEDHNYTCKFISIDPYPPSYLQPPPSEVTELLKTDLQTISLADIISLEAGDLLFIDSSHVAKIGSDVVYEYLEILPSLRPGVFIHVHDIFLPKEYPSEWLHKEMIFWNEQYILQAFLSFNKEFEVIAPLYALYIQYPQMVEEYFPSCKRFGCRPSSFWMQRVPI